MRIVLAYILTPVHYLIIGLALALFHPVQVVAYSVFGARAHKRSVDLLNYVLLLNFYTLLNRFSFYGMKNLPENRPLIIIANHQSMFDAPAIVWSMRRHNVKFISKKELGKGLPSVSYNLRKSGAALIDRNDREQSLREIARLGGFVEQNNASVCIFAEGTRNRKGVLRAFKPGGIKTLLASAPSALIVPYVVHDNYKLYKRGYFPLCVGQHLRFSALEPIEPKNLKPEQIIQTAEENIREALGQ